jgi:hypothetical protein
MRPHTVLLAFLLGTSPLLAQHEGHVMPDGTVMSDEDMGDMEHEEILGQPLGSGTSWVPAGSPVHDHAVHHQFGSWTLMTHGEIFAVYSTQNFNNPDRWPPPPGNTENMSLYPRLERGGTSVDYPNWAMVSAERDAFGDDRILLRAMMSLDPLTVGRNGYPLLFQTGEGLVDRQHAHDLFMELGLLYAHPVSENNRLFLYAGLPGEPALGPTAFMHRLAAGANPNAPLGHHSQDATHITYGVATVGWIYRNLKADASLFNGREPDDERWDIEVGPLDSYSLRLAWNVGSFALQGSGAYIQDPEPGEHGHVVRTTGSVDYNRQVFRKPLLGLALPHARWNNSVVYGANFGHHGETTTSLLRESSLEFARANGWVRWESLQREREELDLADAADNVHWVHAFTGGLGVTVLRVAGREFLLAGQMTFNILESELYDAYGRHPVSGQVFIRMRNAAASTP